MFFIKAARMASVLQTTLEEIYFGIPGPGRFPEITLIPHRSGQRRSRELSHICSNELAGTFASTGDVANRNQNRV